MSQAPEDRERLGRLVDERISELGMEYLEVARLAGFSVETLTKIRRGDRVRPRTLRRFESALGWASGSAEAVLEGGDPAPVAGEAPGVDTGTAQFSDPGEQELWELTALTPAERADHIAKRRSRMVVLEWQQRYEELREENAELRAEVERLRGQGRRAG